MITYTLKKGGVIECTGFTSTFTLEQLKEQIASKEKTIKELASNADIKKLVTDNILTHNKFITKMKPEEVHACFMYHEAMAERISYTEKHKQFKKSLKTDKDELAEILKQIPELNKEDGK